MEKRESFPLGSREIHEEVWEHMVREAASEAWIYANSRTCLCVCIFVIWNVVGWQLGGGVPGQIHGRLNKTWPLK
jgi:hypothetical protein